MDQANWELLQQAQLVGVRVGGGILIFLAFLTVGKLMERFVLRLRLTRPMNADLIHLLGRAAKVLLVIFGAVTALGTAGMDVSALVAGLGLTGFALGFAFRDILSNFLAGILLLFYRPFGRGDRIAVTGLEGTVANIDLRYTILEREGALILIPNSSLFTNPITVHREPVE